MYKVSTLQDLTLRGSPYIFLLTGESNQQSKFQKTLDKSFEEFGEEKVVRAVRATRAGQEEIPGQLIRMNWPEPIRRRMKTELDPFLVIIRLKSEESQFEGFDPKQDDWRIVWLTDARQPSDSIAQLLGAFVAGIQRDQDMFTWLDSTASPETGISPYGGISSAAALDPASRQTRRGRPGIIQSEYGVRETIDRMISDGNVPVIAHGWKTDFVHRLMKENPALSNDFKPRSVYDRLKRCGEFKRIEDSIKSR